MKEAIYLASPILAARGTAWQRAPESIDGARVEAALVRYFSRMTGRATPFGLFAGCSYGVLGRTTELELGPAWQYRRHTRVDMEHLGRVAATLESEGSVRKALVFRPNETIYRLGGKFNYIEFVVDPEGHRRYDLVSVSADPTLTSLLELSRNETTQDELIALLVGKGFTESDSSDFVSAMIESKLLVSDLRPCVTGTDALIDLSALLHRLGPRASRHAEGLDTIAASLTCLDTAGVGAPLEAYHEPEQVLHDLQGPGAKEHLFHVDLYKPLKVGTLGADLVDEILKGVRLLHRVRPPSGDNRLTRFAKAFEQRYGSQMLPLVQVLDEDVGIGFDEASEGCADESELLRTLKATTGQENDRRWSERDQYLLRLLQRAIENSSEEIVLEDKDVERLACKEPAELPDAFAVLVWLTETKENSAPSWNQTIWFEGGAGPSGAELFGRFCYGEEELRRHVERHLRAEERCAPNVAFAEIVHTPQDRVGNISARPVLREWEIPYLGRSGAAPEQQIHIQDLFVAVREGRVILHSMRLNREIAPRLTTAHGASHPQQLAAYRFMSALQSQGVATPIIWSWGALKDSPRLPRVRRGGFVLSRARWRFEAAQIDRLTVNNAVERFRAFQELREELRMPRCVAIVDGDNILPLDFGNALSIDAVAHLLRGRTRAEFVEFVPQDQRLGVSGPEGCFVHELVVPFVKRSTPRSTPGSTRETALQVNDRNLPPGSECLFLKVYTGQVAAEHLLRDELGPLLRELTAAGEVSHWFFVRYADPDYHLRLRLFGDPSRLCAGVLPAFTHQLRSAQSAGTVSRIQLDTYQREVERYGGLEGVLIAERLFWVDSEAALGVVNALREAPTSSARLGLVLRNADLFLAAFGLELEERHRFVNSLAVSAAGHLGIPAAELRYASGRTYREHRALIESSLGWNSGNREDSGCSVLADALAALQLRSVKMGPVVAALRERVASGDVSAPLDMLISSFLHMSFNRLLRTSQPRYEALTLDLLRRGYQSILSRSGHANPLTISASSE